MDFKIRVNKESHYVMADLNDFDAAIDFIKENSCNGLHIRSVLGTGEYQPDFNRFKEIADKLIWLSFSMNRSASRIENFEAVYSLHNLKYLYLNDKENFKIDLIKFKQLVYLGGEYWEGIINFGLSAQLQTIVFSHYTKDDLCEFKNLSNLEILHLYTPKIKTLNCVEHLSNLKALRLARNQELKNISALFESKGVSVLAIEKCKHLNKASIFTKKSNIKELYIDDIDSLSFLTELPELVKLTFLNCKDGNLEPLLKAPNLQHIHFYPNKKHYSHTKEEIQKLFKQP